MTAPSIQRIVLTGGPCGGKSTALDRISAWLHGVGIQVYRVPEAATLLLRGGINVVGASTDRLVAFQGGILQVAMALENGLLEYARECGRHAVVLCDRGAMDGAAYLPPQAWAGLLHRLDLKEEDLLGRYDAVIHMVTTALGAEAHYDTHSNSVRYETLEEARLVDHRLRQAWRRHSRQRIIDNATVFESKLHRVLSAVCEIVGLPEPSHA